MRTLERLVLPAILLASGAASLTAQAPTTYEACYVPSVGAVYLINREGLPSACLAPSHVAFSWTTGDLADGAVTEAKLAFDPATQAELDAFLAGLAAAGTINAAGNPVDWTQLKNVPAAFADGVDNTGGTPSDLVCAGCVETTDLADGAVNGAKVAAGAVDVPHLAFDPATQAELDAFVAGLAAGGVINAAGNPVDWTQLKNVPAGFADGVDDGGGGVTDHGALTGLADDDHPQYLLAGVRAATDGFAVAGSFSTGTIPATGAGTRLMWYPAKAAFRAGNVQTQWDDANVGAYSVAMGDRTTASGLWSTAMGVNTTASDNGATALGWGTTASGVSSVAMGQNTTASGGGSVAIGNATTASGPGSTALGGSTTASGNSSTAMGLGTTASGVISTAIGHVTTAQAYASLAIGRFNVVTGDQTQWLDTDPLFVAGNGASDASRSNALTLYKNGDLNLAGTVTASAFVGDGSGLTNLPSGVTDHGALTGLGDDDHPQYLLAGVRSAPDGFAVTGAVGTGTIPATGAGTRLMWYPGRAAFRAGNATGTQWDDAAVGIHSVAMGNSTTASGSGSTALGLLGVASGLTATAMGSGTTASGNNSTAMGQNTTASGLNTTAMGGTTNASGIGATAMGVGSTASGDNSTAMGWTTTASGNSATAMGVSSTASGDVSTAMGFSSAASGTASTAMGQATTASGSMSTALGQGTTAQSYASVAIGRFNVVTGSQTLWFDTDPLFVAGNGASDAARSDALTLLKNGNLTIAGTLTENSDIRLKEDIEPLEGALDGLLGLTPIRYRFREGTGHPVERQIGLSAQEVEQAFPELVSRDSKGYLSVAYTNLTAVLVRAIQEQQAEIEALRAEVAALRAARTERTRER